MMNNMPEQIIQRAITLTEHRNILTLTQGQIMQGLKSRTDFNYYFDSMQQFRDTLMQLAVERGIHHLLCQGVINKDPIVLDADTDLVRNVKEILTCGLL